MKLTCRVFLIVAIVTAKADLLGPITGLTDSLLGVGGNRNIPQQSFQNSRPVQRYVPPTAAVAQAQTVVELSPVVGSASPVASASAQVITQAPAQVVGTATAQAVTQQIATDPTVGTATAGAQAIIQQTAPEPIVVSAGAQTEIQQTAPADSKPKFSFPKNPFGTHSAGNKTSKITAMMNGISAAKSAISSPAESTETPQLVIKPETSLVLDEIDLQIRNDAQLVYYQTKYISSRISIKGIAGLLRTPGFTKRKTTVFYFPDRSALLKDPPSKTIIQSYTTLKDTYNFIQVDLTKYAKSESLMPKVAKQFGLLLNTLIEKGLDPAKIEFIGYGNGAQFCGLLTQFISFKVGLMVGLDPKTDLLRKGLADFTITVHTDAGGLGTPNYNGDLVVLVNGGKRDQPGCQLLSTNLVSNLLVAQTLYDEGCSHRRAGEIWGNAVINPTLFGCTACKGGLKSCQSQEVAYLGPASRKIGVFYLKTGSKAPFGLGDRGL